MYENLIKAMSSGKVPDESGLSYEAKARNYEIFSRLMKEGVDLQDLVDKASAPKEPAMDGALFQAMESAVRGSSEVSRAKKAQDSALRRVVERMASEDPDYRRVCKEYRDAVVRAYTEKKGPGAEMTKDPGETDNDQAVHGKEV